MRNPSTYELVNLYIRFFGRLGFCLLLFAMWRFYHLFASPLVKKKHKNFIRFYGVSVLLGFVLLISDYLFSDGLITLVAMGFNVITMFVLACYLYYQSNVLEAYKLSDEFKNLSSAMDAMILKMKNT